MYKEKLEKLRDILVKKTDTEGLYFLQDAITICGSYLDAVVAMEALMHIGKFRMGAEEYREYLQDLDKRRRSHHNACIASLGVINKLCMLNDQELIFPDLDVMDRTQVADLYIKGICDEYYNSRTTV